MSSIILWSDNPKSTYTDDMNDDEIDLFHADIQDAIDAVIEDWRNK